MQNCSYIYSVSNIYLSLICDLQFSRKLSFGETVKKQQIFFHHRFKKCLCRIVATFIPCPNIYLSLICDLQFSRKLSFGETVKKVVLFHHLKHICQPHLFRVICDLQLSRKLSFGETVKKVVDFLLITDIKNVYAELQLHLFRVQIYNWILDLRLIVFEKIKFWGDC